MDGMGKPPKWPMVHLQLDLSGQDGGPYMVIARALSACRKEKIPEPDVQHFRAAIAACHSYTAILATIGRWIDFNGGEYLAHAKWIR